MSQALFAIDGFALEAAEQPQDLELAQAKKSSPGPAGNRHVIRWNGLFAGADAPLRVARLRRLFKARTPVTMTCSDIELVIVITHFSADQPAPDVRYCIECAIVADPRGHPNDSPASTATFYRALSAVARLLGRQTARSVTSSRGEIDGDEEGQE